MLIEEDRTPVLQLNKNGDDEKKRKEEEEADN